MIAKVLLLHSRQEKWSNKFDELILILFLLHTIGILLFKTYTASNRSPFVFWGHDRCWVWVLLPSLFFVKILLFDPPALWPCWSHRLAVMSNSVRPTIWRQPCSIHTTATTTLWDYSTRNYGHLEGWLAVGHLILHSCRSWWRLEWRSKTMGQQNHLFGWYGKMANWNFSLSWDISTELADTKKITGGIMSFPLFLEEIFKQKQEQMI